MSQDLAEYAHDLSDELLIYLDAKKIDANIGQAALGTAWIRLCEAMGMSKAIFKDICHGMIDHYEGKEGVN